VLRGRTDRLRVGAAARVDGRGLRRDRTVADSDRVGSRVQTDRQDCRRLAILHRAGQLVAIRVPSVGEEAVRDLCCAHAQLVVDRDRARRRLGPWLLRHDRVYRKGRAWTHEHARWLAVQRFDEPALMATYAHYYGEIDVLGAEMPCLRRSPQQ
jgi:transposase